MSGILTRVPGRGKNSFPRLASPAVTLMRTGTAYFNRPAIVEAVGFRTRNVLLSWNLEKRRIEFKFGSSDQQAFKLGWLRGTCLFCMTMFCSINHIDTAKKRQFILKRERIFSNSWYIEGLIIRPER